MIIMHLLLVKKEISFKMRKKISLILVTVMTAAMLLTGCGDSKNSDTSAKKETTEEASKDKDKNTDEKKKDDKKEDKKEDKTEEKKVDKTEEKKTEEKKTEEKKDTESKSTDAGTEESHIDPENIYAGVWAQTAIVDAIDFIEGYTGESNKKCVSLDKSSYNGEDHWLIGVQDVDDDKAPIYYVYLNEDGCIYGGEDKFSEEVDPDNADETYGGLTELEAADKLRAYAPDGYGVVSSERSYLRNQEKWYMGIMASDGSDSEVYYYYVDSNEIDPQGNEPF